MAHADGLLAGISAVHAAGLDPARWPCALERLAAATGSCAATLERYDLNACRHRLWRGHGVDPSLLDEYLGLFDGRVFGGMGRAAPFPRANLDDRSGRGREPFFRAYLGELDLRYFAVGLLEGDPGVQTVLTVRRAPAQGTVGPEDMRTFRLLAEHVGLAMSVNQRLDAARTDLNHSWSVLDWLADGAALVGPDRRLCYANRAFADILAADDGLRLKRNMLEFAAAETNRAFDRVLATAARFGSGEGMEAAPLVTAPRPSGAPALTLTVRPLTPADDRDPGQALVAVFVRDPLSGQAARGPAAAALGLTPAESRLARALQTGVSPSDYARSDGVSVNTVYTHLRRLKEKAGVNRLAELIGFLNDLEPRLRPLDRRN